MNDATKTDPSALNKPASQRQSSQITAAEQQARLRGLGSAMFKGFRGYGLSSTRAIAAVSSARLLDSKSICPDIASALRVLS